MGCIELFDLLPTGREFHAFVDPQRPIDADAERVHGISNAFLIGKPRFEDAEVCDAFLDFIGEAQLIAHNAAFDRGFINNELTLAGRAPIEVSRWIDTLPLAQKRFPGMANSLDALCKRFKISLAERDKHGALIDSQLLAAVYLELRGGKERGLDLASPAPVAHGQADLGPSGKAMQRPSALAPRLTEAERAAHEAFIAKALKDKAVWYDLGLVAPKP